jgi:hypothetical protein
MKHVRCQDYSLVFENLEMLILTHVSILRRFLSSLLKFPCLATFSMRCKNANHYIMILINNTTYKSDTLEWKITIQQVPIGSIYA